MARIGGRALPAPAPGVDQLVSIVGHRLVRKGLPGHVLIGPPKPVCAEAARLRRKDDVPVGRRIGEYESRAVRAGIVEIITEPRGDVVAHEQQRRRSNRAEASVDRSLPPLYRVSL